MDAIRARALLDLLLNKDSRPRQDQPNPVGAAPGGFAGRANLTVPLATLTSLAGRPGELSGLGPVDPWLARDLATAAAANPKSTWCVTVTDQHGHAVGHGCARPEPRSHRKRAGPGPPGGVRLHPGQPGQAARRLRNLAAAHPRQRAGPAGHPRPAHHRRTATTGLKAGATIRASSSGTCPRSGTPPAPARSAGDPPPNATSSTTRHTKRADAPACVMAARSASYNNTCRAAFRYRGGLWSREARLEPQRCAVLSHPLPRQERFGRGPRRAG